MNALPTKRIPVAVLGATGAVGQTFIALLADHPWFELAELAASERSAGKRYGESARWIGSAPPAGIADRMVVACDVAAVRSPIVFSALDAAVAGELEGAFARAGRLVFSNAKNFRMDADVPLMVPTVNPEHMQLLAHQRTSRGWPGGIVTNANCAATVAAAALAPIHAAFGVDKVFVTTMQAVSGAGYPGVPSLDILGNVIPYIGEEEEKIERELPKILGRLQGGAIEAARLGVSAHANRVAVEHGHTVCLSIALEKKASVDEVREALAGYALHSTLRGLPSAPAAPIAVHALPDRPQPRRDVNAGNGMTVTVGRVRKDPLFDIRLVALGHNTVLGAAGASVLNAELAMKLGYVLSA